MTKSSRKRRRGAKGMGSITFRKDGRWMGRYTITVPNGKHAVRYVYGKTESEVQKKLTQLIVKRDRGEAVNIGGITVEKFYSIWMDEIVGNYLKPTTIELYKRLFSKYILPVLGRKRLESLNVGDVQRWFNWVKKTSLHQAHASKKALSSMLAKAEKRQLIFDNPTRKIETPKCKPEIPNTWSKLQLKQFLKEAKSSSYYLAYVLMANYGLRRGEVLGISWEDIDFANGCIHIRRQIVSLDNRPQVSGLKTECSVRDLPLNKQLTGILKRERAYGASGLIFKTKSNNPVAPRNFYRDFQKIVKRAELPHIKLHAFRHMAACFMRDVGVDPKTCQSILGHATLDTTLKIYQHSGMEHKRDASDKMGDLLLGLQS